MILPNNKLGCYLIMFEPTLFKDTTDCSSLLACDDELLNKLDFYFVKTLSTNSISFNDVSVLELEDYEPNEDDIEKECIYYGSTILPSFVCASIFDEYYHKSTKYPYIVVKLVKDKEVENKYDVENVYQPTFNEPTLPLNKQIVETEYKPLVDKAWLILSYYKGKYKNDYERMINPMYGGIIREPIMNKLCGEHYRENSN